MALIDLKTNLKSLKYGDDRLGGGSSNQPYIQTDINTGQLSTSTSRGLGLLKPVETVANGVINTIGKLSTFVGNVDDGFIRGGAAGAAQASTTDLLRIGKFFTDAPRGPLFIAKQVGLQLSNPRLEVKKGVRGVLSSVFNINPQGAIATLTSGLLQPTRIYNLGINTLAQVPVNAFGGHFTRHGLLPIPDDDSKYLKIVQFNNQGNQDINSPNNRLAGLRKQFNLGDQKPNAANTLLRKISTLPFKLPIKLISSIVKGKPLDVFKGEDTIDFYIGGPKSAYGIGNTIIRRYDYTESKEAISTLIKQSKDKANISKIDYNKLIKKDDSAVGNDYPTLSKLIFTNNENSNLNHSDSSSPSHLDKNVIDYGANESNAVKKYKKLKDAVNNLYNQSPRVIPFSNAQGFRPTGFGPFKDQFLQTYDTTKDRTKIGLDPNPKDSFKYYGTPGPNDISDDGSQIRYNNSHVYSRTDSDILTIVMRIINPFTQTGDRILLDGYMKGYKDNFSSTWNEINYAGRAESFYVYNKFKRSVSFNIQIPCFNRKQLFEKHRALGQLAATTAGSYGPINKIIDPKTQKQIGTSKGDFLGGVLIQLNVGNYLVGEYGILNSLDFSIPDEASWDITPEGRLAMLIDTSFNFTIIHKDLPEYQQGQGFYKYLPDAYTGWITKNNRDEDTQDKINKSFVYDTYIWNRDRGTTTPEAVIVPQIQPLPNNTQRLQNNTAADLSTINPSNLPKALQPPLPPTVPPRISRSQQAKADANSDPTGILTYLNRTPAQIEADKFIGPRE